LLFISIDIYETLTRLRRERIKGWLTQWQIEILNHMDMVWGDNELARVYRVLTAYANEFGSIAKVKITQTYIYNGKEYKIGSQVSKLRMKYFDGQLSKDKIEYLESLGMVWSKHKTNKKPLNTRDTTFNI